MADLTTNINYLQPTSYKLVLDRENYPNLEFFAQTVSHPDMAIQPAELPFRKIQAVPIAGGALSFSELNATVILDEDMTAYTEMYSWIRRLVDAPLVRPTDRSDTNVPSYADITLSILTSMNNQVKKFKYYECIPTNLGGISFETTNAGTDFITFDISFRFTYFELE